MKTNITDYSKILSYGQDNATSSQELMAVLGFSDVRSLRADISRSRRAGQLILSSPRTHGYFLPSSRQEVQEFVDTFSRQAISLLRVLKSARQYLSVDEGQLSLNDLIDELMDGESID